MTDEPASPPLSDGFERLRIDRDKAISFIAEMDVGGDATHGHDLAAHGHGAHHHHAAPDGIEWEDEMAEVNRMTTANTR